VSVPSVTALAAVALVTPDVEGLSRFYQAALGFVVADARTLAGDGFEARIGAPGSARAVFLRLGGQTLELLQFDRPGEPYPAGVGGNDLRFQHFAVVVSDMAAAWSRLQGVAGWTPISQGGPVRLAPASGAVTAFKFRDPNGHPVELLAFPADTAPAAWRGGHTLCLGIDHSAISVDDARRSSDFYEGLGLTVSSRSHNVGAEQSRLDGLADAEAEVVALSPLTLTPHVELLAYRRPAPLSPAAVGPHDIAATRLIYAGGANAALTDPDGHRLIVLA
jgi:catechol 2,3-dioxygenase-like lactoylglutathione lyase family enzyme